MKLDLKELISKLTNTPMVVESGTSGIWTYRKWSNGTAECWGITASTQKSVTSSYGNGYYAPQDTIPLPSGLFTSVNHAQTTLIDAGGIGTWFDLQSANTTNIQGYIYGIRANTTTFRIGAYVIGKWK